MTTPVDFEAEGLVDGLQDDARAARLALLTRLHGEGIPLAALRAAVDGERLALVPVDRALGGAARHTAAEVAAAAGIDTQLLVAALAALGLPPLEPSQRRLNDGDIDEARRMRAALDAGLSDEQVVDANRVIGRAMAQVAAALRQLVGEAFVIAGDAEDVVAARLEAAVGALMPSVGPKLEHAFALHLRELLRSDAIDAAVLRRGALAADGTLSVAFADLVGFTWLGGQIPPDELGRIARRLEELARAALHPPVRLVKTIGDAVMLVAADPVALVHTLLALVEAADDAARADGFPRLRAGAATGAASERDGDVYGAAVNLASRLTAIARPGSVLADDATHDTVGEAATWSFAGERRIRGLPGEQRLFRARRPPAAGETAAPVS